MQSNAQVISGRVLDFGCGSKPYETLFPNATEYVGVDIEVSGHDHINSKVDVYYDGHTLPFKDKSFDSVVAFEVFEHVFSPDDTLAEIFRVLMPGGKFMISVPFAWDEHEAPFDYARYSSFGIEYLLEKNGFNVESIAKTTTSSLAISQLRIAYLHQHVFPQKGYAGKFFQLFVTFPITALALFIDKILPTRYELFCNTVVLASRRLNT